jgi:hypothetical protein
MRGENEIVARALEEVIEAVFLARSPTPEIARALGSVVERLRERVLALRTPPSPQSGVVELYRQTETRNSAGEVVCRPFERATKAESVIEAARALASDAATEYCWRALDDALSALDKE